MGGHLLMSLKERMRLIEMERVVRKESTLADAARRLGISDRQGRRLLCRYKAEGDGGLVHRARGRPSARRIDPEHKSSVLSLYEQYYKGFGPTLASQKLWKRDGKKVHPETLRLWLVESGKWQPRQARRKHRTWRQRKAHFGEMVQMDGSLHDWFEERGTRCFLMNAVDDATGETLARFSKEETTFAAMDLLEAWIGRYGIPVSLYVDRKTVYVTDREPTAEEQLAGLPAMTQFGRACHKLGVKIVTAHSPQAKGRVERKHGVCQDRLLKELRLEKACDIAEGNRVLAEWLPELNQFAVAPRSDVNLHRPIPAGLDLSTIFCLEEQRTVDNDWTVRYDNGFYQIIKQKNLPPKKSKVAVQQHRDGTIHLLYDGNELAHIKLDARPQKPVKPKAAPRPRIQTIPADDHPWRQAWKRAKAMPIDSRPTSQIWEELADSYMAPIHVGAL